MSWKNAQRIGNSKQNEEIDNNHKCHWYINPYFYQQHKQLDLTTIAPKTTHWALRDLLKTIIVNRVVNYRQFKEYILFELEECAAHWQLKTK